MKGKIKVAMSEVKRNRKGVERDGGTKSVGRRRKKLERS